MRIFYIFTFLLFMIFPPHINAQVDWGDDEDYEEVDDENIYKKEHNFNTRSTTDDKSEDSEDELSEQQKSAMRARRRAKMRQMASQDTIPNN